MMKCKGNKKKRKSNFLYDFVKITGAIPSFLWFRLRIIRENKNVPKKLKGGVLIASNHVSFLDPVIVHCVFWYRRLHCLATKDLFSSNLKRKFFNAMNCIMVDKQNFNVRSLHDVCDRLKEEKAVVIFPEGTVNREENSVKDYKSGVILMAHISKKPILPMCIIKPKRWYNRTTVVLGEPVDVLSKCGQIPTMEEIDKLSNYLHDKEVELKKLYENRGR